MNTQTNTALRLIPKSTQKQLSSQSKKPAKTRGKSIVMKVRKTMREDAALLRSMAKTILVLGVFCEALLGYLNVVAMDFCEVTFAGTPAGESFGWISLAICAVAFIYGIVSCALAFVLFTVANSITESTKDLISEV